MRAIPGNDGAFLWRHRVQWFSDLMGWVYVNGFDMVVWIPVVRSLVAFDARKMARVRAVRAPAAVPADHAVLHGVPRGRGVVRARRSGSLPARLEPEVARDLGANCFPSMHTSVAFAILLLALREKSTLYRCMMVVYATSIIFSTVYMEVHWLIDVAGGLVLGWVCGQARRQSARAHRRRRRVRPWRSSLEAGVGGGARRSRTRSRLATVILGLYGLDTLSAPRVPVAAAVPAPAATSGARPRAFVLLLDSLRYQTVTDPAIMPRTVALRSSAVTARVTPTRDAITVPSIRAAFSGRDSTSLLGFVRNFVKRSTGMESIFTQLAAQGRHAAVFSDGAFDQFGERAFESFANEEDAQGEWRAQNAALDHALQLFRAGKHDLVVVHVTYTDHTAHELGIADPEYRKRFGQVDEMVARVAAAIPARDTFVLLGDHGHDAAGRHALGLDVPTFALYRGPRQRAGVDLGTISIRDHRYLMGYALGLSCRRTTPRAGIRRRSSRWPRCAAGRVCARRARAGCR